MGIETEVEGIRLRQWLEIVLSPNDGRGEGMAILIA